MGYIPVFLWKPETQSSCEIFQVGFGLTIPSGTVHRLVGAEEVVELKKKLWHFLCFTGGGGSNCFYGRGWRRIQTSISIGT